MIVGGGPAGLSAALNLGRARASVVLVDAGPTAQRGDAALARLPDPRRRLAARAAQARAGRAVGLPERHASSTAGSPAGSCDRIPVRACASSRRCRAVAPARRRPWHPAPSIVATGLRETLPAIPSLRAFYGMTLFSCAACDAWELQDRRLALIGETPDLAARARLIARWTDRLTVFTHGADVIDTVEEAELAASGITVERRRIDDLEGDRGTVSAVRLVDGTRDRDRRRVRAAAVAPGARLPRCRSTPTATRTAISWSTARVARRSQGCMRRGMPPPRVRSSSSSRRARAHARRPCSCTTSSACAPRTDGLRRSRPRSRGGSGGRILRSRTSPSRTSALPDGGPVRRRCPREPA